MIIYVMVIMMIMIVKVMFVFKMVCGFNNIFGVFGDEDFDYCGCFVVLKIFSRWV